MKHFALQSRDYLDTPDRKRFYNEQLFTEVAPRYDLITRLLSLGRDHAWKHAMIKALPELLPTRCVDIACGTGDLTRMLHHRFPRAEITGIDLTPAMIERATAFRVPGKLEFEVGDMNDLRFPSQTVDVITGGYALRNAPDLSTTLTELHRILKPGGILAFLDFSKPPLRIRQHIDHVLLKGWGGFWGLALHRHADVYGYIAESLARYPDRSYLRRELIHHGFKLLDSRRYMGGMIEWMTLRKAT